MFELGMRLAFDKPTIIVKDDKTTYSFDTSPIEHLAYPRDLRYAQIVDFKEKLVDKIKGTHSKAVTDPNYTAFLKNFGEFTVAKLDKKEITGQEFIIEELKSLRIAIARLDRAAPDVGLTGRYATGDTLSFSFPPMSPSKRHEIELFLSSLKFVRAASWTDSGSLRVLIPYDTNAESKGFLLDRMQAFLIDLNEAK